MLEHAKKILRQHRHCRGQTLEVKLEWPTWYMTGHQGLAWETRVLNSRDPVLVPSMVVLVASGASTSGRLLAS